MNTQLLKHLRLAALILLPALADGCSPTGDVPSGTPQDTNAVPPPKPPAITNSASAPSIGEPAEPTQPEVPFAVARPLPDNISPSVPLKEVIKLAQAGVDEEVLLSFVQNSSLEFNAGPDEIIYLTDIGVPGNVITSLLERDKAIRASRAAALAAPAPTAASATTPAQAASEEVAAAPSYVEPPVATETDATVTEGEFVDALSPYGTWIDVEGYGRCWQPTVVAVNRDWRPYCDAGRWIYTDSGWYWYSDYSWGWAPFHYGRWFSHPRWGWCWYPGYTWGPAWVTWSYTDTYCGWAPLPPAAVYTSGVGFSYYGGSVGFSFGFGLGYACYSYVPWRYFCDYRPWRYCAPRPQCRDIYNRATCHNDYRTSGGTVVNRGLPPDRVSSFTKTEVRKVALRHSSQPPSRTGRGEQLTRDGRTVELRRPRPASAVATTATRSIPAREPRVETQPAPLTGGGALTQRNPDRLPTERSPLVETSDQSQRPTTPSLNPGMPTRSRTTPGRSRPAEPGKPLVVIGRGDGSSPERSTWSPYDSTIANSDIAHRPTPAARQPVVDIAPEAVEPIHTDRPAPDSTQHFDSPAPRPPEPRPNTVRISRGIEDGRSTGGAGAYRVYSSPQRTAPRDSGYRPPSRVQSPEARPTQPHPATPNTDEDVRSNRPQGVTATRQFPQPQRSAPQTAPSQPIRAEPRATAPPQRATPPTSSAQPPSQRSTQVESRPTPPPQSATPRPAPSQPQSTARPDSGRNSKPR